MCEDVEEYHFCSSTTQPLDPQETRVSLIALGRTSLRIGITLQVSMICTLIQQQPNEERFQCLPFSLTQNYTEE